jgi:hypothetical protein
VINFAAGIPPASAVTAPGVNPAPPGNVAAAAVRFTHPTRDALNRACNTAPPRQIHNWRGYDWETDDRGRVKHVSGSVELVRHNRVTTDDVTTWSIGRGTDAKLGDVGFHLVGDLFNGPINFLNVVPGNGRRRGMLKNLNTGIYAKWERGIKRELMQGHRVELRIDAVYHAGNATTRPDAFQCVHRVNNGSWNVAVFRNQAGG